MAVNARLTLDSLKDVRVLDFSYHFSRDIDASGRPSGAVRGGTIQFSIESTKSAFLAVWMTLQTGKMKSGKLTISDDDDDNKTSKTIKFDDSYIVQYGEHFSWQGGENMVESFTISAHKITIEGEGGPGEFENEWPNKKS